MNQNARILEMIAQSQLLYQQNIERILHLISQQNTSLDTFNNPTDSLNRLINFLNEERQRTPHLNNVYENIIRINSQSDLSGNNARSDMSGNNAPRYLSGNNTHRYLSGNNTYVADLSGNITHSNHDDILRNLNEFIGENSLPDEFELFFRMFTPSTTTNAVNRLTTNQINRATTTYNYSLSEPFTCPITLEEVCIGNRVMRINVCGHVFSQTALRQWFRSNNTCPVCRTEVR